MAAKLAVVDQGMAPFLYKTQGTLLDLGCGSGHKLVQMQKHVPADVQLCGLDVNPALEEKWKKASGRINFKLMEPGAALPFEDGSVDVVTTCLSLHHIPAESHKHTFTEIGRVLKEGGTYIIEEQFCRGSFQDVLQPMWDETAATETAYLNSQCMLPLAGLCKESSQWISESYYYKSPDDLINDILACNPHLKDLPDLGACEQRLREEFERLKGEKQDDGAYCFQIPHRMEVWRKNSAKEDLVQVAPKPLLLPEPVVIREREHIPGQYTSKEYLPTHLLDPRPLFPMLVEPTATGKGASIAELGKAMRAFMDKNLNDVGAMLFRGFPIQSANDFSELVKGMGHETFQKYHGNAPRQTVADGVFTASDEPYYFTIEPHQELTYSGLVPNKIFFYCQSAAELGESGELPVVDMVKMTQDPGVQEFMDTVVAKGGIRHCVRYMSRDSGKGNVFWQDQFAETKEEAEAFLQKSGWETKWLEDDVLETSVLVRGILTHAETKQTLFGAQPHCFHSSYYESHPLMCDLDMIGVFWGDGTPVTKEVASKVRAALYKNGVGVKMAKGDVLCLDNLLVAHGRMSYTKGSKRKHVASLIGPGIAYSYP